MKRVIFMAMALLCLVGTSIAQLSPLEKKIDLKAGHYKLKEIINLISSNGINITYNAKALPLESELEISAGNQSVKQILDIVKKALPIEFQEKGDFIILKKRKSNKKFTVSGIIRNIEDSEPLAGASIYIKGSRYGEMSNNDGTYSLNLPEDKYILVTSYVGFRAEEKEIDVTKNLELNIALHIEENQIDEVKVTTRKKFRGNLDLGRNISTIDSKKLSSLNTNNATSALQASMSGVWSTSSSGAPGDQQKVVIRGLNTLFGCTDPLYVIDGVAVPIVNLHSLGIADLNVNDIESITVLKDASSTSLYGYQGGNGVILVETKKNKAENNLSFTTKYGVQHLPKQLKLFGTKDYLTNLAIAKDNFVADIRKFYPAYSDTLDNQNWQDVLFKTGIIKEYQLTGNANFLNNRIYISGNYYDHGGIIANSEYKRYSLMANLNRDIGNNLTVGLNFRTSLQENINNINMYQGNDLIINSINSSPLLRSTPDTFYNDPPKKPTKQEQITKKAIRTYYSYSPLGDSTSPETLINSTSNTLDVISNTGNLELKYFLNNNLFFSANSSITSRNNRFQSLGNSFMRSNENYLLFNQNIYINYIKTNGNHELQLIGGYRSYADNASWKLDTLVEKNGSNRFLSSSLAINGKKGTVSRYIQALYTHLSYNYRKKYFISLVGNYEVLNIDKKYKASNIFPSVALVWDISKELEIHQLIWLNQFNLFTNWGVTGNYPLNALSHDFHSNYKYYYPDTLINGKALSQLSNHDLKQEIITERNYGAEVMLFDRIKLRGDYYNKTSENLIVMRDIPLYYGGGKMFINIGKLENKGLEFSLEADLVNNQNFSWTTNFAISTNKERIIKLGDQEVLKFYSSDILMPGFEVKENEEVGVIMGFKFKGVWTQKDNYLKSTLGSQYPFIKSENGLRLLNNYESSLALNDSDMFVLGKSIPDYTWHWSNTFTYKKFSLDMVWYGVKGVSKFNATKASTFMAGTNPETSDFNNIRIAKILDDEYFYRSSYFVEDASFIRLKQITLSYSSAKKIYNLAYLKLSLSFENLITITDYTGYDPEASIYTDNSFSDFAVDRGAYPVPKSTFISLNLRM